MNAIKYGALGHPSARLAVSRRCSRGADDTLRRHIDRRERRVPMADAPPVRRG